jgi:hypothetical protein
MFGSHSLTPQAGATATSLTVSVPTSDFPSAATINVTVVNPYASASGAKAFVVSAATPVASLTGSNPLTPSFSTAGDNSTVFTLAGTNLASGMLVTWGSDATQIPIAVNGTTGVATFTVPQADLASQGTVTVKVYLSDGVTLVGSGSFSFTIIAAPVLNVADGTDTPTNPNPNSAVAASPATTPITMTGTNFPAASISGFTVSLVSSGNPALGPYAVTFGSSGSLSFTLPGGDFANFVQDAVYDIVMTSPGGATTTCSACFTAN